MRRADHDKLRPEFELICAGYLSCPAGRLDDLLASLGKIVRDGREPPTQRERGIMSAISWGINNRREWREQQKKITLKYRPVFALDEDHEPIWARIVKKEEKA